MLPLQYFGNFIYLFFIFFMESVIQVELGLKQTKVIK